MQAEHTQDIDLLVIQIETASSIARSHDRVVALRHLAGLLDASCEGPQDKIDAMKVKVQRFLATDCTSVAEREQHWNAANKLLDKIIQRSPSSPNETLMFGEYAVDYAQHSGASSSPGALNRLRRTRDAIDGILKSTNSPETKSSLLALKAKSMRQSRRIEGSHLLGRRSAFEPKRALACANAACKSAKIPNSMLELGLCYLDCSATSGDNEANLGEEWLRNAMSEGNMDAAYALAQRYRVSGRESDALDLYISHIRGDRNVRRRYRAMPILAECLRAFYYRRRRGVRDETPFLEHDFAIEIEAELANSISFGPPTARAIILLAELKAFRGVPWALSNGLAELKAGVPDYWNSIITMICNSFGASVDLSTIAAEAADAEVINQLGTFVMNFEPQRISFAVDCYRQASSLNRTRARFHLNLATALELAARNLAELNEARGELSTAERCGRIDRLWLARAQEDIDGLRKRIDSRLQGGGANPPPHQMPAKPREPF